ncbi:MAG TPA: hypothetical protein VMS88_03975 [Terriglobales bacterium]|nr:hypothetical protein [Terriglobales bacterium]
MKKLLFLALLAVAAWYGWQHYGDLITRRPSHTAVIVNHSGRGMARVRLAVGGQTFVRETIADDAQAVIPFRVDNDASFQLVWEWADAGGEHSWSGGLVPKGPMAQRHIITVDPDGEVVYQPRIQ